MTDRYRAECPGGGLRLDRQEAEAMGQADGLVRAMAVRVDGVDACLARSGAALSWPAAGADCSGALAAAGVVEREVEPGVFESWPLMEVEAYAALVGVDLGGSAADGEGCGSEGGVS